MKRALASVLLATWLAGCGESEPPARSASTPVPTASATAAPSATATGTPAPAADAESEAVAAAIERYAAAVRAGDERTICTQLLSRKVLERVKTAGGDCERDLIASAVADGGPEYRIEVESIDVSGDEATARTRAIERDGPRTQAQPLVREGGRWKLSI